MPLTVHKDSEFFIAMVKQGRHSSLMPGVMIDGQPRFLARIGKDNEIDASIAGEGLNSTLNFYRKVFTSHTDAFLADEDIFKWDTYDRKISYQAYSITLEQYQEFLSLIADIENHQIALYKDKAVDKEAEKNLHQRITCYTPGLPADNGQVTLTYTSAATTYLASKEREDKKEPILKRAVQLNIMNTCRTTARDMLDYTLGFSTKIPSFFAIGLDYKTTIKGELQTPESFYILPPPPPLSSDDIAPAQLKVLKELYKKLEDLPKHEPNSETTRNKFNKLKNLYKGLAPTKSMPLQDLLDTITMHRAANSTLFDTPRAQSIIGKFAALIGLNKTGTQQAYDAMEKTLNQEIKRQKSSSSFNFSSFKERFKAKEAEKRQITEPVNDTTNASTTKTEDTNDDSLPSPGGP